MQNERKVYSVSELTEEVKELLEYNLDDIIITGEISNFRVPASGHYYFTLKDENAQIKAVMFRQTNIYLRFTPKEGMQILGRGRVSVYGPQGTYQIILDHMDPIGIGSLKQAYDDLKEKLKEEGLFDEARKRELPMLIKTVGVVTSRTGAAIKDFISVATRRFSDIHIIIYPVRVQGKGAAEEISEGIKYFNRRKNVDAIVVTRGGGSFEDLFCFSEEIVARTIYASKIPVISAVGHEIDSSISDYVADVYAPTPSAAAEMIIAKKDELAYKVSSCMNSLAKAAKYKVSELEMRVDSLRMVVTRPKRLFDNKSLRIDDLTSRLITLTNSHVNGLYGRLEYCRSTLRRAASKELLEAREIRYITLYEKLKAKQKEKYKFLQHELQGLVDRLELLNPYNILKKGYSITMLKDSKKIITSFKEVKPGDEIEVMLGEGRFGGKITDVNE
jgi:exodeoxyribonuclease VII large subunit